VLPRLRAGNHHFGYEFVARQASGLGFSEHVLLNVRREVQCNIHNQHNSTRAKTCPDRLQPGSTDGVLWQISVDISGLRIHNQLNSGMLSFQCFDGRNAAFLPVATPDVRKPRK
jgi:hypothetical protein